MKRLKQIGILLLMLFAVVFLGYFIFTGFSG